MKFDGTIDPAKACGDGALDCVKLTFGKAAISAIFADAFSNAFSSASLGTFGAIITASGNGLDVGPPTPAVVVVSIEVNAVVKAPPFSGVTVCTPAKTSKTVASLKLCKGKGWNWLAVKTGGGATGSLGKIDGAKAGGTITGGGAGGGGVTTGAGGGAIATAGATPKALGENGASPEKSALKNGSASKSKPAKLLKTDTAL